MTKLEHGSARRSRQLIRDAFLAEVAERDIEAIRVTDVVRRAGVNRSTFYAHYSNIEGLLADFEGEILEKLRTVLRGLRFPEMFENPEPSLRLVAQFIEADADAYRTLLRVHGSELFVRELEDVFGSYLRRDANVPTRLRDSATFEIRVAYFTGGIINLYGKWLLGELAADLPEVSTQVAHLVRLAYRDTVESWGEEMAPLARRQAPPGVPR